MYFAALRKHRNDGLVLLRTDRTGKHFERPSPHRDVTVDVNPFRFHVDPEVRLLPELLGPWRCSVGVCDTSNRAFLRLDVS